MTENSKENASGRRPGIILRLVLYFIKILREFLKNTVLNGLKYLAYKYLIILEKLFFLICFIAVIYNSLNFALNIIEKWKTSPVLIIMNPESTLITTDPFPAVTICNMNQASLRKVKNYSVNSNDYAMLQKICFQELNYTSYAQSNERSFNDSFAKLITRSAQSCADLLVLCRWGLEVISCTDMFREVLLDEGICCSFNIAHPFVAYRGEYFMVRDFTAINSQSVPVDWHPEKGYPKDLPTKFYPRKPLGQGVTNGLTLIINGDINDYYCSSTNGPGIKLQLHNAIDTPTIKDTGISVSLGHQTNFRISVRKEEAQESLRSVAPKERNCYFSDEHDLKYFRYYTRRNCEAECDASFFLRTCNCIPYYLPLIVANATYCYVEHFDCVVMAEDDYSDAEKLSCKTECLSGCYDLWYIPYTSVTPMAKDNYHLDNEYLRNFTTKFIGENLAVVNIYFPLNYYRSNVRTPYTGYTEYLSQTGGIMSLMMGFSVISVVEFVYFFVMKPLMHLWRMCLSRNIINVQPLDPTNNIHM